MADAYWLLTLSLADRCLRIFVEPQEPDMPAALATVEAILEVLDAGKVRCPRLVHGEVDEIVWPLLGVALERGYATLRR